MAKSLIPYGVDHGLIIQSVATCLRDDQPYLAINGVPVNNIRSATPPVGMNPAGSGQGKGPNGSAHTANAGRSRFNVQSQHFLGGVFSSRFMGSTGDDAVIRPSKWLLTVEKTAWSALILGSFIAGLASL